MSPHQPARSHPPKSGRRSECRRVLQRAGVVASTTVLVMQLPGQQPRSAVLASAANPWPGAGSLLGKLRHGWGKPLVGWGERGWDAGVPDPAAAPCCSGMPPLWVSPPGELPGSGEGQWGRRVALGSQVPWQGSAAPGAAGAALAWGSLGGRSHFTSLEPAQSHGAHGGGHTAPCWGSERSPLPLSPRLGRQPMRGRGRPGRKRLPAGLDAGYKGGPESLSRMRWHPSRFPRRPRCRKYTRSWWRLPQRWAGCHAAGGAQPQTQVCRRGTPAWGGGSTVGWRSWALAGTKGSCPGSAAPACL